MPTTTESPVHRVGQLLIRLKSGVVLAGEGLHIFVCQAHQVSPNEVIACGFVVKGPREIWEQRKPD